VQRGEDPQDSDGASAKGCTLRAQVRIARVLTRHQKAIRAKGMGKTELPTPQNGTHQRSNLGAEQREETILSIEKVKPINIVQ
jgi:hypothetical protein